MSLATIEFGASLSSSQTVQFWLMSTLSIEGNPDAGQYTDTVEAVADSTASSSEAPAPARRSSRKRAASAVHSEAPPSKVMSAESGVLGSGKR